jgi:hypothetical protein
MKQREVAKQAKAALALFTAPTSKGKKASKKTSKKASEKEPAKKSSEKEKASKTTKEGAVLADAPAPELCNEYQFLYDKKKAHKAYVEQHKVAKEEAKATLALFTAPTSKDKKASKKASEKTSKKASEKEPAKKSSEKEKASKKTKEGVILANAPAQNFAMSTRPSTIRPLLQKRPPRTRKKLLLPRCFSSMQTCCLWMPSVCGTR